MNLTITKFSLAISPIMLSGCIATMPGASSSLREVDVNEAFAMEKQIAKPPPPQSFTSGADFDYVQPANKTEKCLLPTSKEQLDRRNFIAYWDGDCKDGHAFGLGRDIAISDTHHLEEIINHKGPGYKGTVGPMIRINYVDKSIIYGYIDESDTSVFLNQSYKTNNGYITPISNYRVLSKNGDVVDSSVAQFNYARISSILSNGVVYRVTDNTSSPVVNPNNPNFTFETINPSNGTVFGFVIAKFPLGQIRHIKMNNGSSEDVKLPDQYIQHLEGMIHNIQTMLTTHMPKLEAAKKMETEYLYYACNEKYSIKGLSKDVATKICTWREAMKPQIAESEAKFKEVTADMKRQESEIKRNINDQQQREYQARLAQQRQSQIEMQQLSQSLANFGQQMQNSGQQMLNSVSNMPVLQVVPIQPQRGSVNCLTTGPMTNCRY